jgi:hypothetical protein
MGHVSAVGIQTVRSVRTLGYAPGDLMRTVTYAVSVPYGVTTSRMAYSVTATRMSAHSVVPHMPAVGVSTAMVNLPQHKTSDNEAPTQKGAGKIKLP